MSLKVKFRIENGRLLLHFRMQRNRPNTLKKDPQPKWLRAFESIKINALRTEAHDEHL